MPPAADWMLMAALRDSENWLLDFEGTLDEATAAKTEADEMPDWYVTQSWPLDGIDLIVPLLACNNIMGLELGLIA